MPKVAKRLAPHGSNAIYIYRCMCVYISTWAAVEKNPCLCRAPLSIFFVLAPGKAEAIFSHELVHVWTI